MKFIAVIVLVAAAFTLGACSSHEPVRTHSHETSTTTTGYTK